MGEADFFMDLLNDVKDDINGNISKVETKIDRMDTKLQNVILTQQKTNDTVEFHSQAINKHETKICDTERSLNELNLKIREGNIDGIGQVLKWFFSLPKWQMVWITFVLICSILLLLIIVIFGIVIIYNEAPGLVEAVIKWIQ